MGNFAYLKVTLGSKKNAPDGSKEAIVHHKDKFRERRLGSQEYPFSEKGISYMWAEAS